MGIPYAEVIGDPIAHSKSPLMHKFWLEKAGIEGDYRAMRVSLDDLAGYFENRLADPDWRGCNVTSPLKVAAFAYGCNPDEFVGAANLLSPSDGKLLTANTDYLAICALLEAADLGGRSAIVIGAGGAARAALAALRHLDPGRVTLLCRSPARGEELLRRFGLTGAARTIDPDLPEAALVINATPLGMTGAPPLDLRLDSLSADAVVFDMVYSPVETDLLSRAGRSGRRTIDGLDMLIEQGAHSFGRLFNAAPPRQHDPELRALLTR